MPRGMKGKGEITMSNRGVAYKPQSTKQHQTVKEIIAANVQALIAQLEAGH
jgi:hypothetical protein